MKKLNIPDIIPDNDAAYFNLLEEKIKEVDSQCEITAKSSIEGLVVYVLPSLPHFRDNIVKAVRKLHYLLDMKVEFSKSLLISKYVTFKVKIW